MAPGTPLARDDDAQAAPTGGVADRTALDDELRRRSAGIVGGLSAIVAAAQAGKPLDRAAILAAADEIAALREALAFADAIAPLAD
jgi:hypothetical protein